MGLRWKLGFDQAMFWIAISNTPSTFFHSNECAFKRNKTIVAVYMGKNHAQRSLQLATLIELAHIQNLIILQEAYQ